MSMQSVRQERHANHWAWTYGAVAYLALAMPIIAREPGAAGPTLDRIKQASAINLGYRADARPFSYKDDSGAAAGYSVDLCQKIADQVKTELKVDQLTVNWVPVTADDRFTAVAEGKVDLSCG